MTISFVLGQSRACVRACICVSRIHRIPLDECKGGKTVWSSTLIQDWLHLLLDCWLIFIADLHRSSWRAAPALLGVPAIAEIRHVLINIFNQILITVGVFVANVCTAGPAWSGEIFLPNCQWICSSKYFFLYALSNLNTINLNSTIRQVYY